MWQESARIRLPAAWRTHRAVPLSPLGVSIRLFPHDSLVTDEMGFGSYDESEQENQQMDSDLDDSEAVNTAEHEHEGKVNFEFDDTDSDDLLDQLKEIKGE